MTFGRRASGRRERRRDDERVGCLLQSQSRERELSCGLEDRYVCMYGWRHAESTRLYATRRLMEGIQRTVLVSPMYLPTVRLVDVVLRLNDVVL
jgi:hypothetical protein